MTRLFLSPEQLVGPTVRIEGEAHRHLARVLRMQPGERVTLLDGEGQGFAAILQEVGKAETVAELVGSVVLPPEPRVPITVAQALGKGDKFEQVVQHGTEVGASAFVPVQSERCVGEIPASKVAERVARWQRIAQSGAEQSGRARIPVVHPPVTMAELLSQVARFPTIWLHPAADALTLKAFLTTMKSPMKSPSASLWVVVGPEGGWSPNEIQRAQEAGAVCVSLGGHILRTETAALVALSQILYSFEAIG